MANTHTDNKMFNVALEDIVKLQTNEILRDILGETVEKKIGERINGEKYEKDEIDVVKKVPGKSSNGNKKTDEDDYDNEDEDDYDNEDEDDYDNEDEDDYDNEDEDDDNEDEDDDNEDEDDDNEDEDDDNEDEAIEDIEVYEIEPNTYNLVDADDEVAINVFKKLNGDANIAVVKTDNGIQLSDNETGAEYIININEDIENYEDEEDEEYEDEEYEDEISECGNTDWKFRTVQHKTAMSTNGVDPKNNDSFDKVPRTNDKTKRFGHGPGKGEPYMENSGNEITEAGVTRTKSNLRMRAGKKTQPQIRYTAGSRVDKVRDGVVLKTEEINKINKLIKEYKSIKNDNAILKEAVKQFKEVATKYYTNAIETALTNQKLGKAVKLFSEHATTKDEKIQIIDRLQKGSNPKEIDSIFEAINIELKTKKPIYENINNSFQSISDANTVVQPVFVSEQIRRSLEIMGKIIS